MKISLRRMMARRRLRKKWHRWFAWHPVRIGRDVVWLEWTLRREYFWANFDSCGHACDYAHFAQAGLGGIDTRVAGGSPVRGASPTDKIDSDVKVKV